MKKGFTLIELLAVVAILSFILLIGTSSISKIIKENKQKLYDKQIEEYVDAVKMWSYDNTNELPSIGNSKKITLNDLITGNYVKDGIINPLTDEPFSKEIYFCIKNLNNNYIYEYEGEC